MRKYPFLALAAVAAAGLSQASAEQEFVPLQCSQAGTIIFTSDVANVAEFPASQYHAEIVQVIALDDPYANLYLLFPGSIICLVDAAKDQTDTSVRPQR